MTLAAVPDHPLNANRLHVHLSASSMADRDSWWSTFIHRRYEAESAVDRLLDWASSPFRKYKLERSAAILYGTAVCWLFTTSNRFLRDHATKSLVQAIDDDIDVLVALIEKFRSVNDPYVKERICAVAFGCAMKTTNPARLKSLGTAMYDWIFAGEKVYSHILVRDYARGVIEAALEAGQCQEVDPRKIRPPYKSTWPKKIPSEAELKSKYGWDQDGMPQAEWARLSIYHSVMGWGDFARYVIGTNSGSFEWSDIKLGKRPTVTAKEKHDAFVDGLRDDQRKAWDKFQELHFRQIVSNLRRRAEIDVDSDTGRPSEDSLKDELKMAEKKFEATLNPTERRIYRRDVVAFAERNINSTSRSRRDGYCNAFLILAGRWRSMATLIAMSTLICTAGTPRRQSESARSTNGLRTTNSLGLLPTVSSSATISGETAIENTRDHGKFMAAISIPHVCCATSPVARRPTIRGGSHTTHISGCLTNRKVLGSKSLTIFLMWSP